MEGLKFSFVASLPAIQSAIKIDGSGDGARIQIEIPGTELEAIIKMQVLCGKSFKVTVEETEDAEFNKKKGIKYIK